MRRTGILLGAFCAALLLAGCGQKAAVEEKAEPAEQTVKEAEAPAASAKDGAVVNLLAETESSETAAAAAETGAEAEAKGMDAASVGEGAAGTAATASTAEKAAGTGEKLSPLERYFTDDHFWDGCPERNVQLLTPNEYSRPGIAVDEINDIVVHYVDEPGSTAMNNRDYFESLKDGEEGRSASSHFVISLDGEIVQCVPLGEVAYASNHRNHDTISIECCHPDETGEFTEETYKSCADLCAWLCYAFEISPDHVIRHYDVTEKICPKFYVDHPDAWELMKKRIAERYDEYVAEHNCS